MDSKLSQRVQRIKPSPTLAVAARAAALRGQGHDIVSLSTGEPDFDTPEHVKQAAIRAIQDGFTKYTAVDGIPELKQAVVDKLHRENQLDYALEQVLVSVGAKHALYNLFQALLDAGDEVIIPAPYWVSYPDMVLLADATPVIVSASGSQGFKLNPAQLEEAITERTRLLVLNSPSNPTGVAYSKEELEALGEVLRRHPQVMVVSDDIYEHILWSQDRFYNILNACPDLYERTIVLNGVSKAYAMTGWRIGYAAGPSGLVKAMKKIQSQSTSNPNSIAQVAAQAALEGDQGCIRDMLEAFKRRHDYVVEHLNLIEGVYCLPANGTFYAFPDVRGLIAATDGVEDDVELAQFLMEKVHVALVPGAAFGAPGHLRLSFATSDANLESALNRLSSVHTG